MRWSYAALIVGCVAGSFACARAEAPVAVKSAEIAPRASFPPPSLDGGTIVARNVELHLPRGCAPLGPSAMAGVAALVDDAESELLAACNIVTPIEGSTKREARVTWVLMRHRVEVETGESAARSLRRAPGIMEAHTTSTASLDGLGGPGAEVVVSYGAAWGHETRPSTALWFGAKDGLYVLYAEVDADLESLSQWGEALPLALRPTASARPIRWRAPSGLSPSSTAAGPFRLKLPEGVSMIDKASPTFGAVVGDPNESLSVDAPRSFARFADETNFAVRGAGYSTHLLSGVVDSPAAVLRESLAARGLDPSPATIMHASIGDVSRVDLDIGDHHEVYAAFLDGPGEVAVFHFAFAAAHWDAYAPLVDPMLASLGLAGSDLSQPD